MVSPRLWRIALAAAFSIGCGATAASGEGQAGREAVSVREIVEVTDFSGLSTSPDGRFLVFRAEHPNLERNSYDFSWFSVDASSGRVSGMADGGDPIYDDPGQIRPAQAFWSGGDAIVFPSLREGAIGLWRASVDGARVTPVVVSDSNVEKASLSPDRSSLLYSLGPSRDEIARAERREYDSGTLVDGSVDFFQALTRGGSVDGRMATQRLIGYWFIRDGLLWRSARQRWKLDLRTGVSEPIGKPEPVPDFSPPKIYGGLTASASDGSEAEVGWDGKVGSLKAKLAGKVTQAVCADPSCAAHISWLVWIPGGHQLAMALTDRNMRQTLAIWNVDTGTFRKVLTAEGLLSGSRSRSTPCAVTETAAFCVTSAAAAPPRIEEIELTSGTRKILYDPNKPLRSKFSPVVEQLQWTAEGTTFNGTLLTPRGADRRAGPLFINFYWCEGFLRGGGEGDAWPAPSLVDAGIAVACVNVPPSSLPQDAAADYRIALTGVRGLVQELSARKLIDPARVGMGGFSHGSEIAIWTAMKSSLLAAVSISSAQSEPSSYWIEIIGAKDREKVIRDVWHLGDPDKTPGEWKAQSPALNVNKLTAPIIFQMPEQEARRVPELLVRLNRSSTPAELYAYPDEDHIFVQPRHEEARYTRNLDWFRYWLQSQRDPDPAKSAEYGRWDILRDKYCRSSPNAPACSTIVQR